MEKVNIVGALFLLSIVTLVYKLLIMSFKIGFYEQTLKNHSAKFSENENKKIKKVMETKNLFKLPN